MLTLNNEQITPLKDKNEFSQYIETYAINRGVGLMTAMLQYCEDADVNIESCAKLVSESLKEKIEDEAIDEKYMTRKTTTLSFFE